MPKKETIQVQLAAPNPNLSPATRFAMVQRFDRVLGLNLAAAAGQTQTLPPGAAELIERREAARAERDWAAADRLRQELATMGVDLADTRSGTTWRLRG